MKRNSSLWKKNHKNENFMDLEKMFINFKKARICKCYTQESLAELSGVNIKSIAAYEQNPAKLSDASVNTILKLCDSLGVDIEDIIN